MLHWPKPTKNGDIDGVAATAGPGLIGGVAVGTVTAKAIAAAHESHTTQSIILRAMHLVRVLWAIYHFHTYYFWYQVGIRNYWQ